MGGAGREQTRARGHVSKNKAGAGVKRRQLYWHESHALRLRSKPTTGCRPVLMGLCELCTGAYSSLCCIPDRESLLFCLSISPTRPAGLSARSRCRRQMQPRAPPSLPAPQLAPSLAPCSGKKLAVMMQRCVDICSREGVAESAGGVRIECCRLDEVLQAPAPLPSAVQRGGAGTTCRRHRWLHRQRPGSGLPRGSHDASKGTSGRVAWRRQRQRRCQRAALGTRTPSLLCRPARSSLKARTSSSTLAPPCQTVAVMATGSGTIPPRRDTLSSLAEQAPIILAPVEAQRFRALHLCRIFRLEPSL